MKVKITQTYTCGHSYTRYESNKKGEKNISVCPAEFTPLSSKDDWYGCEQCGMLTKAVYLDKVVIERVKS